jgi:hypothetical protein
MKTLQTLGQLNAESEYLSISFPSPHSPGSPRP